MSAYPVIDAILELAKWAPSGDNTQPWAFEIIDATHLVVHASDTRANVVYDLDGHPSQIAVGALLETLDIAASAHGLYAEATRRALPDGDDSRPQFDVHLVAAPQRAPSALLPFVTSRSVQRRPLSTRRLHADEKAALASALGPEFHVDWHERAGARLRMAMLMYDNAKLRLTMPEAYEVHRRIIHWGVSHSADRVPDQALGVDALTLRLMKWAMVSWRRLALMNTIMGTWAPRLQMDFVPGMACAAHFVIRARQAPRDIDDYVAAGRAVQRFWLALTGLGLHMQPEMTPLIFARYCAEGRVFSAVPARLAQAARLRQQARDVIGAQFDDAVFLGRLGAGSAPSARSLRQPLDVLMVGHGGDA